MTDKYEALKAAHQAGRDSMKYEGELPPVPDHPEPRTMKWTTLEIEAIQDYARQAIAGYLAKVGHSEQAVRTLAAIDEALGIGDDGCSDPEQTLEAIANLKRKVGAGMTATVTREMIGAAHDIMLARGDFVLSAALLEKIYLAMEQAAPPPKTPFNTCPTCEALARAVMADQTGTA